MIDQTWSQARGAVTKYYMKQAHHPLSNQVVEVSRNSACQVTHLMEAYPRRLSLS
jgi:hypothetical protein